MVPTKQHLKVFQKFFKRFATCLLKKTLRYSRRYGVISGAPDIVINNFANLNGHAITGNKSIKFD